MISIARTANGGMTMKKDRSELLCVINYLDKRMDKAMELGDPEAEVAVHCLQWAIDVMTPFLKDDDEEDEHGNSDDT